MDEIMALHPLLDFMPGVMIPKELFLRSSLANGARLNALGPTMSRQDGPISFPKKAMASLAR